MDEGGSIPLTTDSLGHVHYTVSLNALISSRLRQGDSVQFSVEYITPALEVVTDTVSLPVSFSSFMIGLRPASQGLLPPGVEFAMFAVAQDVFDGSFISNLTLQMTLHEWNGSELSLDRSTGLVPITTPSLAVPRLFIPISIITIHTFILTLDVHAHLWVLLCRLSHGVTLPWSLRCHCLRSDLQWTCCFVCRVRWPS